MSEPTEAQVMALGNLVPADAPVVYGIIQAGPEVPNGVPYVRPTEIRDGAIDVDACLRCSTEVAEQYERARLREGDVILSIVGTIGKVAIVPATLNGANINQSAVRIRPPSWMPPAYLKYVLQSDGLKRQYRALEFGNAVRRLNVADVRKLQVRVAPRPELDATVAHLDACFERTKRAKKALDEVPALLDRLRQSILAAAFRGDLTADWRAEHPDVEPASEVLKRIRVERRRRWDEAELAKMLAKGKAPKDDRWTEKYVEPALVNEDELPALPDGWRWASVDTVGHVLLGRRRADAEYIVGENGRVLRPYVRVANVKDDRLDFGDVLTMGFSPAELETYRLLPGDVVISEGQSLERIGQSAMFRGGPDDMCIQATVHRFRAYPGLHPDFAQLLFMHYVRSGVFQRAAAITTNIAHLTSERLRPLPFPLPPSAEQDAIVRRTRSLLGNAGRLADASGAARLLIGNEESALLARAFSASDPAENA